MSIKTVDRTVEIEERLKAIHVSSEDTCGFWEQREDTNSSMRLCFFCKAYCPGQENERIGTCRYKAVV